MKKMYNNTNYNMRTVHKYYAALTYLCILLNSISNKNNGDQNYIII